MSQEKTSAPETAKAPASSVRVALGSIALFLLVGVIAWQLGLLDGMLYAWTRRHFLHEKPEWGNQWYGIPMQQYPQDLMVYHDLIYKVRPDVIVETGTYNGASSLYFATLLEFVQPDGKVVTVDLRDEGWQNTRKTLDVPGKDRLLKRITFVKGSSIDPDTVAQVKKAIPPGSKVLVMLDSVHTRDFVLQELEMYAPLVTKDSYLIVNDTQWGEPLDAVRAFVKSHPDFVIDESVSRFVVSCAPSGFLKRVR